MARVWLFLSPIVGFDIIIAVCNLISLCGYGYFLLDLTKITILVL